MMMSGNTTVKVSVIVPTYNSEGVIGHCLESLINQSYPRDQYEVIVSDDGSIDETRRIAESFPGVRFLGHADKGPSSARNAGACQAVGDIIVFTDSDCVPCPDWLEKMVQPFLRDPEVVAVKGAYRTRQKERVARFCQKEFEERYRVLAQYENIDFVDSHSAAFRKAAFWAVGGFDSRFPVASNEDVELSYKLAAQKSKMVFVPEACVYHRHPTRVSRYLYVKFTRGYWRMLVYKRFPKKAMGDTYTPTSLKIQLLLAFAFMLSILGWLGSFGTSLTPAAGGILTGLSLLVLVISTLPLTVRIYKEDPEVGVIAPFMLVGRALVFVMGTVLGITAFFTANFRDRVYPATKRVLDLVVSFLVLLVVAPFFALIGLLVMFDSGTPVIFRQKRMGFGNRQFTFYKFRTMYRDAESKKDELRDLSTLKGPVFKIKNDPRITRMGKILRRFSLDELPQLFNVLKGSMSLVGPRPLPMIDIEHPELLHPKEVHIDPARYRVWLIQRHSVPPGLTGLWQIKGRSDLPLEAWFNYDLEYVKTRSIWLDSKILMKTIPVVILGKGAQ